MRTDDLQREQQEAVNDSPFRHRLLREVSGTRVQTDAKPPQPAAGARDLNQARFARRVDSLFNQRWLGGFGRSQRKSGALFHTRPAAHRTRSNTSAA